jgi:chemotaxis protein MotA
VDILTLIGVIIGFAAIIGGNFLEGGHIDALLNGPAAIIVLGGTIGAAVLQTPKNVLLKSLSIFIWIIKPPSQNFAEIQKQIIKWAEVSRKNGLLGLENLASNNKDPFIKKGLQLLIDGKEPDQIRAVLELELCSTEQNNIDASKVYEAMGGYAPTIGIIGAVMGLIHVMGNLSDPSMLGGGIAVAFVATIYGVGIANLFLIPVANKLQAYSRNESQLKEMIIEGLISIAEGEHPRNIAEKLNGFF